MTTDTTDTKQRKRRKCRRGKTEQGDVKIGVEKTVVWLGEFTR